MFMNFSFQQKWTSWVQNKISFNSQLFQPTCSFIFYYTQFSLPFILLPTDDTTAAGINVQSHCSECLMYITKIEDSFLPDSPPCCQDRFLFCLSSLWFIHQFCLCLHLFYQHPAVLYSFTAVPQLD